MHPLSRFETVFPSGTLGEPLCNLESNVREVNDPRNPFALRFAWRNYPPLIRRVYMPSLDAKRFLRSTTGLPCRDEQLSQRVWLAYLRICSYSSSLTTTSRGSPAGTCKNCRGFRSI